MCGPNFSPSLLWRVTHSPDWIHLISKSNFIIRLLLGWHGLESNASRFSMWKYRQSSGDPSCRLCAWCSTLRWSHSLYITCTMLEPKRRELLSHPPPPCHSLGIWIDKLTWPRTWALQVHVSCWELTGLMTSKSKVFCIKFLVDLKVFRPKPVADTEGVPWVPWNPFWRTAFEILSANVLCTLYAHTGATHLSFTVATMHMYQEFDACVAYVHVYIETISKANDT